MIDKLNQHYSFTNPATVHDEEALTVLELCGRLGYKLNEIIDGHNNLENKTIPETIDGKIDELLNTGVFDDKLTEYAGGVYEDVEHLKTIGNDSVKFSSFDPSKYDNSDDRLEDAFRVTAENGDMLYLDETVCITREITIPSNLYVTSNPNKYKIYTETGDSLNGLAMLVGYGASNITFDGVAFENTGFGSSGSGGTLGSFSGFGAALNIGGGTNITVKNCRFFKCGGYNYSEGCAMLWISCCKNVNIDSNYLALGDNGIVVDRWYGEASNNYPKTNQNISITNNIIEHISGRGIGIENSGDMGGFTISNNRVTGFGYAGIEGRNFADCIFTNNYIDGDKANMVNPISYYKVDGMGWDWSTKINVNGTYTMIIQSGGGRIIFNSNIAQNTTNGLHLNGIKNANVCSNIFKNMQYALTLICTEEPEGFVISDNHGSALNRFLYIGKHSDYVGENPISNVTISGNNVSCTTVNNEAVVQLSNVDSGTISCNKITAVNYGYVLSFVSCVRLVICGNYLYGDTVVNANDYLTFKDNFHKSMNAFRMNGTINNIFIDGDFDCINCFNVNTSGAYTGQMIARGKFEKVKTSYSGPITIGYVDSDSAFPFKQSGDVLYYNNPASAGYYMAVANSNSEWQKLIAIS